MCKGWKRDKIPKKILITNRLPTVNMDRLAYGPHMAQSKTTADMTDSDPLADRPEHSLSVLLLSFVSFSAARKLHILTIYRATITKPTERPPLVGEVIANFCE
jgi:hypothetical protein